jgi:hypothetical protein
MISGPKVLMLTMGNKRAVERVQSSEYFFTQLVATLLPQDGELFLVMTVPMTYVAPSLSSVP